MRARSFLLRLYDFLNVELALHSLLKLLIQLFSRKGEVSSVLVWFYKSFVPRAMRQPTIINDAEHALTLHTSHHYYFRHVEMEVFVPKSRVAEAVKAIRFVTSVFAGIDDRVNDTISDALKGTELYDEVMRNKGKYTHHYPFFFRHILPDDALISMTAGSESYYSVSFFTYLASDKREGFWEYTRVMAFALTRLYGARLHWGKHFPLKHGDIAHLYPNLPAFRRICKQVDPNGVFVNTYAREVMGF
jgi:FAD/FMN-containing dehydrogenase